MEKKSFPGHRFWWKIHNPTKQNYVKSILKLTKEDKDGPQQPEFLESFTKIEEAEQHLEEEKPLEWMNDEIKTKKFNISNDYQTNMAQVGDYCSEKWIDDIVDLLREYQYVFV
jgi:hypothetical protein